MKDEATVRMKLVMRCCARAVCLELVNCLVASFCLQAKHATWIMLMDLLMAG